MLPSTLTKTIYLAVSKGKKKWDLREKDRFTVIKEDAVLSISAFFEVKK